MTKPDEIASFSQFSVVSHMLWMPKHFGWTCGPILKYHNFDHFYPQSQLFFSSSLAHLEPKFWSLGVDAIGDDDDLSHVYLLNLENSEEKGKMLEHVTFMMTKSPKASC